MMIISSELTWRTFLDDLCRRMKAKEKQTFTQGVGVSMATINRWRRGEDCPKAGSLERLLAVLSDNERSQLLSLLRKDPKVWSLLPSEVRAKVPVEVEEPSIYLSRPVLEQLNRFCLQMLRLQRDAQDRFWQLGGAILSAALKYLEKDSEENVGIEIVVVKLMPPREDGKVRSLCAAVGMGTLPWRGDLHVKNYFLGGESLAGYAVTRRHGEMIADLAQKNCHAPVHPMEHECSTAAFPIMRGNFVAGALVVSCTAPHYFNAERMAILEIFSDIIRLAFYDNADEFYPVAIIDLGLMPPLAIQIKLLATFRHRVEDEYRRANRESSGEELTTIEERVRRQLEGELLQMTDSGGDVPVCPIAI